MNTERSEKNGSTGVRFGATDIAIILLVIISVASIVIRMVSDSASFGKETEECVLQFEAVQVRYTTYDALEAEGDVYIGDRLLGKLSSQITYAPSALHTFDDVGAPVDVHYPENTLIDITGEVECSLVKTEGGYVTADGIHLAPGTEITLKLRTVDLKVTVISLSPTE